MASVEDLALAFESLRDKRQTHAERVCRRIVRDAGVPADLLLALGRSAFETGRYDLSLILYRRAVELRPDLAELLFELGYHLIRTGRPAEAVGALQGFVQLRPDHSDARAMLSSVLSDPAVSYFRFVTASQIDLVFDVGANVGQFARALRTTGYTGPIVSVEPLLAAFTELERASADDPLWVAERIALGPTSGDRSMHVAGNAGASSSLLPMLARHVRSAPEAATVGVENVRVETFDALFARHAVKGHRAMLKLDTQGYERQVFEGAAATLAAVQMIYLEMSLVPLYEGQALMPELSSYLYERGFVMVDLERYMFEPQTRRLLQVNATFLQDES